MTTAQFLRSKIRSHPAYKFDSVVSDEIVYDLVQDVKKIQEGDVSGAIELLGAPLSKTSCFLPDKCKRIQEEVDEFTKIMKITKFSGTTTGAQC